MRDALIGEISKMAAEDPMVTLITGDLGFGVLTKFAEDFPNQYINAGVAEQNMTAIACGMAMEGHRVYTYSIGNFCTLRCLEQIRNDVCYHDADVTVISIGGGFSYGQLGVSHFTTEDIAILRTLPKMTVLVPTDPWEAALLAWQAHEIRGPKYLRIDKGKAGLPENPADVTLGKARVLREGSDVTLVGTGAIVSEALAAAGILATEGIEARVLGYHTVKPFDVDAVISAARETAGIVTVEEHTIIGGLGGAVAEACLEGGAAPGFFRRVGIRDEFPTVVGDQPYLRGVYGMDAKAVVEAVRSGMRR